MSLKSSSVSLEKSRQLSTRKPRKVTFLRGKRFVLIDGNALLHRAYHAMPPLTTSTGELVNAVYGFTLMLLRTIEELDPQYIAVCWDRKAPTFRHIDYVGYKAHRVGMDEGLAAQLPRTHQIVETLNIPSFGVDGYEADDLIGTLAKQAAAQKVQTVIVTGDRDALQLLNAHTKVFMPKGSLADAILYDETAFEKQYGFPAHRLADFKGLAGDSSDNIPGVRGIGEVTAAKLIAQFGNIEDLYRSLDKVPSPVAKKLITDAETAVLSKRLATIATDAPVTLRLADCTLSDYDRGRAQVLFEELEFRSLIKRLPHSSKKSKNDAEPVPSDPPLAHEQDQMLTPVLEAMSKKGILISRPVLARLEKEVTRNLEDTQRHVFASCGHKFNLNSPKQLGQVLFDELHLPVVKKTKTGRSTDESVLHGLFGMHPCVEHLLSYRELFKLKSTYIDAWFRHIDKDSRIHSTFRAGGAVTGRLSSSDPNIQNIPIKGDWGMRLRRAVIAPPRFELVSADYSQIELRVMAHIAQDLGLKRAFEQGLDIHTVTASRIFEVDPNTVTVEQRRAAKTIVFGLMYGMGAHSLATNLTRSRLGNVDHETAQHFIDRYFSEFPKALAYMQRTVQRATERGYVETLFGRKRLMPELASRDGRIRAAGERMAINFPIQGTAADIINKAMMEIYTWLVDSKSKSAIILQVHDELLLEVPAQQTSEVGCRVKALMEGAVTLSVPLVVEARHGPNWGDLDKLVCE